MLKHEFLLEVEEVVPTDTFHFTSDLLRSIDLCFHSLVSKSNSELFPMKYLNTSFMSLSCMRKRGGLTAVKLRGFELSAWKQETAPDAQTLSSPNIAPLASPCPENVECGDVFQSNRRSKQQLQSSDGYESTQEQVEGLLLPCSF